jgi:hypothetical protein
VGDTFSAEAWVKRTSTSSGQWETVVSKQGGSWLLMFDENNDLVLRRSKYGNVAASTTPVSDTNWHYIAASKGGSSVHLYVDGKDVTGPVSNATMTNNTSPLVIGESSASSWFEGAVDEVAVYKTVLSPETVASHYDVGRNGGSTTSPPPPSTTPTPPPPSPGPAATDPIIAAAGDIACSPNDPNFKSGAGSTNYCRQRATAGLLDGSLADILTLGDNQYENGELSNFRSVFDLTWGAAKSRLKPSAGNREYNTSSASGYFDYFNGAGIITGARDRGYFSYDVGSWHLISLNSNCSSIGGCYAGSAQEQWLRADLAAHPNRCTLAYWHHPLFTSGQTGNSTNTRPLFQALYDANAEIVLSGHDHDYERFAPQTPAGGLDNNRGVREFVVGTGGESHHPLTYGALKNEQVRNDSTFGVIRLTLHPGSYDWKFQPIAGQTFTDSGSTACH